MNPVSAIAPVAIVLLLAGLAAAHQQKAAVTRVLFNERTGNIEVMHRFVLHDAEHAVREIFGVDADIVGSAETRRRFAGYVAQRFAIRRDGIDLELSLVGSELDGGHLWVYQEAPIPESVASLSIRHDALRDVWPSQSNLVNVERAGETRSLRFDGEAAWQRLQLP